MELTVLMVRQEILAPLVLKVDQAILEIPERQVLKV
jgi:hypothetical protein